MGSMAIGATRDVTPALGGSQTMHAGAIGLGLLLVASGATDRLGGDVVIRMLGSEVGVTPDAVIGFVGRTGKAGGVDKKRDLLAGRVGLGQGFIAVAVETGAILDRLGGLGGQTRGEQNKKRCSDERSISSRKYHTGRAFSGLGLLAQHWLAIVSHLLADPRERVQEVPPGGGCWEWLKFLVDLPILSASGLSRGTGGRDPRP